MLFELPRYGVWEFRFYNFGVIFVLAQIQLVKNPLASRFYFLTGFLYIFNGITCNIAFQNTEWYL